GPRRRGRSPHARPASDLPVRDPLPPALHRRGASAPLPPDETESIMKLIQVKKHGGPEELQLADAPIPQPTAGQAVVHVAATGVNFIDVYFRTGLYKADLPLTPGSEAAGTVESVGEGVTNVKPG